MPDRIGQPLIHEVERKLADDVTPGGLTTVELSTIFKAFAAWKEEQGGTVYRDALAWLEEQGTDQPYAALREALAMPDWGNFYYAFQEAGRRENRNLVDVEPEYQCLES